MVRLEHDRVPLGDPVRVPDGLALGLGPVRDSDPVGPVPVRFSEGVADGVAVCECVRVRDGVGPLRVWDVGDGVNGDQVSEKVAVPVYVIVSELVPFRERLQVRVKVPVGVREAVEERREVQVPLAVDDGVRLVLVRVTVRLRLRRSLGDSVAERVKLSEKLMEGGVGVVVIVVQERVRVPVSVLKTVPVLVALLLRVHVGLRVMDFRRVSVGVIEKLTGGVTERE
mmetsp:Transcript_150987/g.263853  ORF Transcript_150987/g.263853 Transcript_150987/m.263853 type:complete len:226 (+) Transcript_150987:72-749(+)